MGRIRDQLSKLAGTPRMAHLTRGYPGEPTHNGFVLGLGRELILFHQFHDFYPEGYTALRVADVKRIRSGEHERFWEAIFQGEGLMERVVIPYGVPLDDFRSLLAVLHERGQHVIVECEGRETAEDDRFFIGRIIDLGDEEVSLRPFDPLGRWDEEICAIGYGDVTKVQFDTPYINTLSLYLSDRPNGNGRR